MDAIIVSGLSVFWFFVGFILSMLMSAAANKRQSKSSSDFEKSIRALVAKELEKHTMFQLGIPLNPEELKEMSSEIIGFNLGLHTAGLIINSDPGDRLLIVEKVGEDGEIVYDVERL